MRFRSALLLTTLLAFASTPPLRAQKGAIDLTTDLLDRFLKGYDAEAPELTKVDPQLADLDARVKKFRDCQTAFLAAANATSSATLGFAARAAMKIKCGATSEDDFTKERQKIMEGPETVAQKAGGFAKLDDYRNLKDKITGYLRGDRNGFTKSGLELLASRESALSSKLGIAASQPAGVSTGVGMAMPGVWSMDYAWVYVGQLFAMQYMSGATVVEKEYTPGQWSKWEITPSDNPKEKQTMERAFLGKTADGGEWWRLKSIMHNNRDGKDVVDTVTLEALFKPMGPQIKQLVRMRGKLPGNPDPQEMIVPQTMAMLPLTGAFGMKPTPESLDGATVGTETVDGFSAKHVKFGMGNGTIEWWLADAAPGGVVRFKVSNNNGKGAYQMEMVGQGTGATSELGIKF